MICCLDQPSGQSVKKKNRLQLVCLNVVTIYLVWYRLVGNWQKTENPERQIVDFSNHLADVTIHVLLLRAKQRLLLHKSLLLRTSVR